MIDFDESWKQLLQKMDELKEIISNKNTEWKKDSGNRLLLFTEKEIMKMPKTFRKSFRIQGCTAHVRKKKERDSYSYEINYAKISFSRQPIFVTGNTLEEAKRRFIEKLYNYESLA